MYVSYALELMDDAEIYSNVYVQFASASTRYLHLRDPLSASINCISRGISRWSAQVLPLLLLRYVIVIQMWADSSTPSEPFLPVLLRSRGVYGMPNAVSYIPPTCRKGLGPVSRSYQSSIIDHPTHHLNERDSLVKRMADDELSHDQRLWEWPMKI